ncbi:hypothetical protein ERO13_D03G109750v2 [Gossypium hirsutum]|nr:hypothetical protein ERO13_D03G109750v2 [Gossypium hirsutum]TYI90468.1 hypothetical protein E1A91_D03G125400v1 [Gossypium mustelinum]
MLLGGGIPKLEAREVDNLKLQEGDVITRVINGIPSICFSERIHLLVEKSMRLSMVIKMGRKVDSNALLRCILSRNQS